MRAAHDAKNQFAEPVIAARCFAHDAAHDWHVAGNEPATERIDHRRRGHDIPTDHHRSGLTLAKFRQRVAGFEKLARPDFAPHAFFLGLVYQQE
jgi:hypothetical protein